MLDNDCIQHLTLECFIQNLCHQNHNNAMVNFSCEATINYNGFSMVLTPLDHHHWMFLEGPTIGFNGFSMVLAILRALFNGFGG